MNINRSRRPNTLFYHLILILMIACAKGGLNSISASPLTINSIATYTWSITLSATPYHPLTLTFPTQITILNNCSITVNGVNSTFTKASNTVIITSSIASSSVSIIVSNIQNPPSAISTYSFSYITQGGVTESLQLVNQIQYQTGTLSSCPWSFSLCTEQSNSDLLVSFTTTNKLLTGNNYFLIGYTSLWPNHQTKGLVTGVSTVTCSYSTNSSTFMAATTCTIDGTNNQIIFLFNTGSEIGAGTSVVVKVSGVIAPPTKTVTTSSNYFIFTADSTQTKIDGLSGCSFSSVCVTNLTNGVITNSVTTVNASIGNPSLVFSTTPLTITIQPSDTIEVYYSPFSSLMSCSTFKFYRSGTPFYSISTPITNSNYISFTYPNSQSANTQYSSPFYLFLDCTSFLLPSSQTPTILSFIWKRNSLEILHLNATVTATASTFNSSKASLSLSSTSMIAASIFTFNFLLGQTLGNNPAIKITFPTDFTIGTPICSASILSLAVSSATCSVSSNTITIVIATSSLTIPINSNITLTIQGITNPSFPKSYSFPLNTYYDSAVSTSRVETSLTAFTTTITQISNYPVTLTPTGLTVFSQTNIILTFTSTIPIPSFTTFYIQFPAGVSSIAPNGNLFAMNGSARALSGSVSTNASGNSVTFVSGTAVAVGDIVSITIPLKTPSNIATYSFVKLIVTNNSTGYLSSRNTLFLNVNSVSSMSMQIAPVTSIAGSVSSYTLTLFLTIPHSTSFVVQVDVPSDTSFITSSATCTNCLSSVTPKNSTSLQFTANNPEGTSATSITFTLSSFVNPRSIGSSLLWGVSTKTVSPSNLISYQTASATISSPNTLTAVLSKSDPYYRNNSSPVKMTFKFTNSLASGDSIQLSATNDVYSPVSSTSVTCSNIYGSCSLVSSSDVTVIKITPNVSSIINNTFFVIVQGLISGSTSGYSFTYNIGVTTMTSNSSLMDSGTMVYNVSCGQNSGNNCKRCYSNGSCIDCYLPIGYYLYGSICVTRCGSASSYVSYANDASGNCVTCINNCATCESDTYCRSCITNYYLYPDNTCRISCATTTGYYIEGTSADFKCKTCITNCLECVNGSNSCTRCDNTTLLISGSCLGGCGSTNYYQLNGQCILCDVSCYNCSGAGAGSCYSCSANYHKYTTLCVSQCPNGTAVNPSTGDCGCDSKCLTCSTYTACTACFNSSFWVMNGACISQCPTGTYANLGQCFTCSTGCQNCTINSCLNCISGSYLYNNTCYSDCNLISLQYDNSGITCILCPSGCDRCTATTCSSCLSDYTMMSNNSQCIKTCLLDNSCDTTTQVLPLPGFIALAIWIGISIIIHFVYHKNYLPYSIILLSGIIQFVLLVGLLASLGSTTSRLLATSTEYVGQMRGLLAAGIALNYLQNITYIILFVLYIKPLVTNPRQIDVISNVTVLIIALLTNFRFGLIAFSRMFPKPNIYIQNASKLTPIHYLCIVSMFLDVIALVGCGLGVLNAKKLSNTFMLSIDLLVLILVNYAVTICFVSTSKPDSYYEQFVKKYHMEENINQTDETLANEKNVSKAKMAGQESFNFDEFEHTQNEDSSYKKLNRQQDKLQNQSNNQSNFKENVYPVTIQPNTKDLGDPDPFMDPNFQTNLKSKKSGRGKESIISSKVDFNKSFDQSGKSMDDNLSTKKNNKISNNLSKEVLKSERKKIEPQKNIVEVSQSDYPELEQESSKQPNNLFNAKKEKLNKPKRSKQITKPMNKTVEEPLKIMKKGDKIGYFQSDAYDSNIDGQDLQEIIKQKIWQSSSKIQKRSMQSFKDSNQQTGHEQISPSWFNIQNQRLDITDLQQSDQQQ